MVMNVQITISPKSGDYQAFDTNVEMGMFKALSDLIMLENYLVWDPVGAFFVLTTGHQIHKYRAGGGAVFDSYGQQIFITDEHIDSLFKTAQARAKQLSRHRSR